MVQGGFASGQNVFQVIGNLIEQPTDSLPLTLWKYSQMPYPERVDQAWAAALILIILILLVNVVSRLWVQWRSNRLLGK